MAAFRADTRAIVWGTLAIIALASAAILWKFFLIQREQESLRLQVIAAQNQVADAYKRLEAIFFISQKFVQAEDENEIIDLVLKLSVELVGAVGASFVPLNERGQPSAAISHGKLPFPVVMNDWVEYLASPSVRERCNTCEFHGKLVTNTTCPLLVGPSSESIGMFCLPLRHGDREFGVLNLFLPRVNRLDAQSEAFLQALMDETALALEGVRLRKREVDTLRQVQTLRQKADLTALLKGMLEDLQQTLKPDFCVLSVQEPGNFLSKIHITLGDFPIQSKAFLDGVIQGVMGSGDPVLLGEVEGERGTTPGIFSLAATPMLNNTQTSIGVLVVGNRRANSLQQRHLSLLNTAARQIAVVVQNANLMAELEYSAMIQERTRLAREIHDGLAQTLGFLKLQMAQMKNYLAREELERLSQSVELSYTTLSEAYQDARQAIDGLRIWPKENGLFGWLEQTVREFEDASGLPTELQASEIDAELPSEVHAQLIRIIQEALSNIRKHAKASHVWVSCRQANGDLWLEVRDDGVGFSSDEVASSSRHGLRGMRERSELIGADFQIINPADAGTIVRVRLPLVEVRVGDGRE